MKIEKFLPIGSVVLLKNAKKRLMITGFCAQSNDNKITYDYVGCLYPQGTISTDTIALFNHDDISIIYNVGYIDNEEIEFKKKLKDIVDKK